MLGKRFGKTRNAEMAFGRADWHQRYHQQSLWTRDLRSYLYSRLPVDNLENIIEVGCGTGVILKELLERFAASSNGRIYGLDFDEGNLRFAKEYLPQTRLCTGDAHRLPYADACFDLTVCHFLLLWVKDPGQVLQEMVRVTRSGGAVAAFAEPDYSGRIDYPETLAQLGEWQVSSLQLQGANPRIGRMLCALLHRAGLINIQAGVLGNQWYEPPSLQDRQREWAVLQEDLDRLLPAMTDHEIAEITSQVEKLRAEEEQAWERGDRILFVPTFYAWGVVAERPS